MSSFISNIGKKFNMSSNLKNPATWLTQLLGGTESSSGIHVTMESALGVPEIWNCVSKITGALSMMEMECWRYDENGSKTKVVSDAGSKVYNDPNEMQISSVAIQKVLLDALMMGNGRYYIERNSMGVPKSMIPLQAEDTQTVVVDGERWHCVTIHTGTAHGSLQSEEDTPHFYKIPDADVFYIMGLSRNGYWGENLLSVAKDTIGLAIAGGESAGTVFQNSGRPGLILQAPMGAFGTNEEAQAFLDNFNAAHTGIDNQGKTGLLRNGMTALPMSYPTMDVSHIGMRQFQRESAALLFLLESIIGDSTGSVYKSVSERQAVYLTNCLGPWIRKIEKEADKKLMSYRASQSNCKYRLDISPMFKNDRDGLALYTSSLRQQGIISANEARELHGLPPDSELEGDYGMSSDAGVSEADPSEELQSNPNETESQTETLKED
jgi:HK97 family phage portal protein